MYREDTSPGPVRPPPRRWDVDFKLDLAQHGFELLDPPSADQLPERENDSVSLRLESQKVPRLVHQILGDVQGRTHEKSLFRMLLLVKQADVEMSLRGCLESIQA